MGKKSNWRFKLFIVGAVISCLIAIGEIVLLAIEKIDLTWESASLFALAAILPVALFGSPYINSRFSISYDKRNGLEIKEETKTERGQKCQTIDKI
jgi:hypothetical protein